MTTTTDAARAEFMRRLDAHEELVHEMALTMERTGSAGPELVERIRMSRRAVVAAFDQAALMRDPEQT